MRIKNIASDEWLDGEIIGNKGVVVALKQIRKSEIRKLNVSYINTICKCS